MAESELIYRKAGSEDTLKTTTEAILASTKAAVALLRADQKSSNATLKSLQATVNLTEVHLRYDQLRKIPIAYMY